MPKPIYAALTRATARWRGIEVTAFERKQAGVIREEFDAAHSRCHVRPLTRPRRKKGQDIEG